MLNLPKNKIPYFIAGLGFAVLLQSCTEVSANTLSTAPNGQVASKITPSLSAAQYDEPVCFAHNSKDYDGVVSLHKTTSGNIVGKSFGVKQSVKGSDYAPFEQKFKGRYVNNNKISVSVLTVSDGAKTKRRQTLSIKGQTLRFDKLAMRSGECKRLVNSYLSRDMERRRAKEQAAKRAFLNGTADVL